MSEPLRIWALDAPFDKYGVPRMGNVGQSIRRVVVIEATTFKRLIAEHPTLAKAEFLVGSFDHVDDQGRGSERQVQP